MAQPLLEGLEFGHVLDHERHREGAPGILKDVRAFWCLPSTLSPQSSRQASFASKESRSGEKTPVATSDCSIARFACLPDEPSSSWLTTADRPFEVGSG